MIESYGIGCDPGCSASKLKLAVVVIDRRRQLVTWHHAPRPVAKDLKVFFAPFAGARACLWIEGQFMGKNAQSALKLRGAAATVATAAELIIGDNCRVRTLLPSEWHAKLLSGGMLSSAEVLVEARIRASDIWHRPPAQINDDLAVATCLADGAVTEMRCGR